MRTLQEMLRACAEHHTRACPRQVLGLRMGLLAGPRLRLELPREDRRLLVIAETDGCFVDALAEVTGCRVGARTLRIEDCGKVAATFVDVETQAALRIVPHRQSRMAAAEHAPGARSRWHAQLEGYARMPDELLLSWHWVSLATPVAILLGRAHERVTCPGCGEEIINQRVFVRARRELCRACAGEAYYRDLPAAREESAARARGERRWSKSKHGPLKEGAHDRA